MASTPEPVYTSPRTEAHLRDILSRISSWIDAAVVDLTDIENDITALQTDVANLQTDVANLQTDVAFLESILLVEATFNDTVVSGDLLYAPSSGAVALARADAAATARVVGMAVADVTSTQTGLYLVVGAMDKTGWGLTTGATYYLSPTLAGKMSTTQPTTAGHYIVQVGRALETEKFSFAGPQLSILL